MSALRGIIGAALGATVATVALRARVVARERGAGILDIVPELPMIIRADAARVTDAARAAIEDGRIEARRMEEEIEQVLKLGASNEGTA